jgi:hypothetical protein
MTQTQSPPDELELQQRVEQLTERVEALEEKLEAATGTTSTPSFGGPAGLDARDSAVVDALDAGDVLGLKTFRRLYRDRTDIRQSDTVAERVRNLTQTEFFEEAGHSRWRYVGGGSGE